MIQLLAIEFSKVINEWFTSEELAECIALNKTEEYQNGCCASHNYYDTNMAMDEAFQKVMGREFVFFNDEEPETEAQNEADTYLHNAAWTLAKEHDFNVAKVSYIQKDNLITIGYNKNNKRIIVKCSTIADNGKFLIVCQGFDIKVVVPFEEYQKCLVDNPKNRKTLKSVL